ncbi:hypothetical protein J6590_049437 [Homalodisca vitripennis]|nr:hypothetical protein J6590_049437 [Homalodisca vitripennis]
MPTPALVSRHQRRNVGDLQANPLFRWHLFVLNAITSVADPPFPSPITGRFTNRLMALIGNNRKSGRRREHNGTGDSFLALCLKPVIAVPVEGIIHGPPGSSVESGSSPTPVLILQPASDTAAAGDVCKRLTDIVVSGEARRT